MQSTPCRSMLVVEDDDTIRQLVTDLLSEEFRIPVYGAKTASLAQSALVQVLKPCLIILDIFLPDATGWDFLRDTKRGALMDDCRVLVTSASASVEPCEYPFIRKPWDLDHFVATVRDLCGL